MLNGIIVESVSVPGGSGIERGHRDTAIDCRPRNLPGSVLELQEIACAGNADQGADSHNDPRRAKGRTKPTQRPESQAKGQRQQR